MAGDGRGQGEDRRRLARRPGAREMVQGKRRLGTAIAAALLCIAGIVGCSGNQQQPAGSTKVTMSEYKFAPSTVNVKPGKVTLYLVNGGTMNHDLVLSDKNGSGGAKAAPVSPGQTTPPANA